MLQIKVETYDIVSFLYNANLRLEKLRLLLTSHIDRDKLDKKNGQIV